MTAAVVGTLTSSAVGADEAGPWQARLRAVKLSPANHSGVIRALAVQSDAIHLNCQWLPKVDFEYFLAPRWSSETVLGYAQA